MKSIRTILVSFSTLLFSFAIAQNSDTTYTGDPGSQIVVQENPQELQDNLPDHSCGFDFTHQQHMLTNELYQQKTEEFNEALRHFSISDRSEEIYRIPCVVHVMETGTAITEITDNQIRASIQSMNEMLRKIPGTQGDADGVDVKIEFALAVRDPQGNCTDGIVRVDMTGDVEYMTSGVSRNNSPGISDANLKAYSSWDQSQYYNIFLVNSIGTGNVAGYAYFASAHGSPWDGTVILTSSFRNPENTTATHEIGHAFNVYHTFEGDANGTVCPPNLNCTTNGDRVCDTPPHIRSSGCNTTGTNACDGNSPNTLFVHNYMDYSSCRNMFTDGQKTRMLAALELQRSSFLQENGNLSLTPPTSPTVDFETEGTLACGLGESLTFTDMSSCIPNTFLEEGDWGNITFSWNVSNGLVTYTSNIQNPTITFNQAGVFDVTLTVAGPAGSGSLTKQGYVVVEDGPPIAACTPTSFNESGNYALTVFHVGFNTIDKSTSAGVNGVYEDFSCTDNTVVASGETYPLSVSIRSDNAFNDYTQYFEAYIDFNDDGIFSNPAELVSSGSVIADVETVVSNVLIPTTAVKNKLLRMRIYGEAINPLNANKRACTQQLTLGDVEDYGVYISDNVASVSIIPTPGNSITYGQNVTFTATPVNGGAAPTYQWFRNNEVISNETSSTININDLLDGESLYCVLTSNLPEVIASPCTSNVVTMEVVGSPLSDFSAAPNVICSGSSVEFADESLLEPTSWLWSFPGGSPASSVAQNPIVTYNTPGTYDVTLTASNALGTGTTETKTQHIQVLESAPTTCTITRANAPTAGIGIHNVSLNTIDHNTSWDDAVLNDYSCSQVTTLEPATQYEISVQVGTANDQWLRVYIDYNNNGVFTDPDELVFAPANGTGVRSGLFTTPAAPDFGNLLKMRVISDFITTSPGSCTNMGYGQAEEYGIIFHQPPVLGCTDPEACNYDPNATSDDGSCDLITCLDCNGDAFGEAFLDNCGDCVEGNTGEVACVADCHGDFGGTAYLDDCDDCVGGNTGETACIADCNGDFGGTAYLDDCNDCVGGNTGETACVADCNGDFGGTAFLDNCGDCVEGNTGEVACVADCHGDFGGTAYLDDCDDCVGGNTGETACIADCNGDFGGTAYLDDCNDCVGGNTGETACVADCNGDFGGTAFLDNCGDCVEGNTGEEACVADCNGDFGGTAFLDNCDDCVGGNTGETACVADCNGDFGGTAYLDNCGDCVEGNTGEVACEADCNGDFGGTAFLDNCGDCVEGNTGEEACEADCNGDFGGTAFLDSCGDCVEGNTGEVACEADCNGDFGGTAFLDNCGDCVGGNTGETACTTDCNGDFGGTAFLDDCNDCVGGNTGEEACVADCNGDFGGTAFLDNCGDCVEGNTGEEACEADCNGDFGGTAFLDNCGDCVEGNTGEIACEADCNGDFGGSAFLDNCGDCVEGNTGEVACEADCNGDFGGTAFLDNCGDCVGGNTGETACLSDCNGDFGGAAFLDNCGDCVGGNTGETACVADCNGDFGGTAYLDDCDDCVGGNTGETPCELCDLELLGSAVAANPGTPDGSASVSVTGGTEPYEYAWNDPLLQTTAIATGLFSGSYIVTVTDASDCEDQLTVVVPVVSNVPNTQVAGMFCNTSGYHLSDFIAAVGVSGADAYRWEFTDSQNNTLPEYTRLDGNKWVRLEWITDIETGETYDVRVKARVGGAWGEYATVCSIGVSQIVPTTELRPNYTPTNAQGNDYSLCDFAIAYNISNSQDFRWRFDGNGTFGDAEDIVYTRGTSNPSVRLNWVNGLVPGLTYNVGVEVQVDGNWSQYGTILPLTLGLPPNDVVIRPQFCGDTYSPNGYIMSQSVCEANLYQFRFTPTGGGAPSYRNSGNYVCFMSGANPALTPGDYDVQVKVTQNGVPGDWGPVCPITISGPQGLESETPALRDIEQEGGAALFPNPSSGAEVRVNLDGLSDGNHKVMIQVYDVYGKLIRTEGFGHEGKQFSRLVRFDQHLPTGVYVFRITVDKERFTTKRLVVN